MAKLSFSGPVCNRDRIVKVLVAGLGILICTASGQAKAAPVTFDALGVFDGGTIMHGTITIDTATGKAVWADLVIYRAGQELQFYGKPTTTVVPGYVEITVDSSAGYDDFGDALDLVIPAKSLVGYDGGELVPDSGGNKVFTFCDGAGGLLVGTLEP